MYTRLSAPLSVGGVVDDAIRLYRGSFSRTWKLSLGFALLLAVVGIAMGLLMPGIAPRTALNQQQALRLLASPAVAGTYILLILCELAYYGALFACVNGVAQGRPVTAAHAAGAGLQRLPGMLLAALVFCVVVGLGTVLLIVPGVFLWGRLELWPAALFAEDATAMGALGSSWNLTKGRWWRTVTIMTVALIIVYIVTLAVGLLPGIFVGATSLRGGNVLAAQLIALPFSVLGRILITPAMVCILLAVHHDCRLRSSGDDLAERAAALGRA